MEGAPSPQPGARAVALGLAVGDSLGATSEFADPPAVGGLLRLHPGWPDRLVGGGSFGWPAGAPTDDTDLAMATLRALLRDGVDGRALADGYIAWMRTGPMDIGGTTGFALERAASSPDPHAGGRAHWQRDPGGAANGSLMRNGVVAGLFPAGDAGLAAALDATLVHGAITHFGPVPQLCCLLQTDLLHGALHGRRAPVTTAGVLDRLDAALELTLSGPEHPLAAAWLAAVGPAALRAAAGPLAEALRGFEAFDPFAVDYSRRMGWSVLTLKIALWSLFWSLEDGAPPAPPWLPAAELGRKGFAAVALPALIGADSDTYGATAGALLGAWHPAIPPALLEGLQVHDELCALLPS